jgi:hypothetical protein
MSELEEIRKRYEAALHAMQSGVSSWMQVQKDRLQMDPDTCSHSPKHLRVGINSALCDTSALAKLLIAKGVISEIEYYQAITDEAEAEVARYEKMLSDHYGARIHLA